MVEGPSRQELEVCGHIASAVRKKGMDGAFCPPDSDQESVHGMVFATVNMGLPTLT